MPTRSPATSKRQELIAIASRLFYAQGYGMTGIKQIIEEAGIAKGTFYTHFASKEELGLAWLQDRHQRWTAMMTAELEALDTPAAKILGIFGFLASWMEDDGYRGCAFINTCAETPDCDSPLRQEVASHKQGLHAMFQDLACQHRGLKDNSGDNAEARQLGTILYLLFEGALLEAQIFRDQWPIQAARTHVESLLNSAA